MDAPTTRAGPKGAPRPARAPLPSCLLGVLRRPRRNPFRRNREEGSRLRDGRAGGASLGVLAVERAEGPLISSEFRLKQEYPLGSLKGDRGASSAGSAASGPASWSTCFDAFPQRVVEELSETDDRSRAAARVVPLLPLFVAAASTFSPPGDRLAESGELADFNRASTEETPRTDTSSCDAARDRHLPLAVPGKSTPLPEEAPIQDAPSAQASGGPLISRLAQLLLCCSSLKNHTQQGASEAGLEWGREGPNPEEAVKHRSNKSQAEPLVYGHLVLPRPPEDYQTRPSRAPAKKRGVAFEPTLRRERMLPQPTVASRPPPPFEMSGEQQTSTSSPRPLKEEPLENGLGVSPAPEAGAWCPWALLSCFSLGNRGEPSLAFTPSWTAARGLSSYWAHPSQQEDGGPRCATCVVGAPRAKCLRRLRDEQRQTWMEYQEVIMEDNSKRRQWVDVGDEGDEDGQA
ncbi:hypothetical protein ACSSS7_000128 [Eimeria intestinalis]